MRKSTPVIACLMPLAALALTLAVAAGGGCGPRAGAGAVKLATTTSTDNSGLLEYILPLFEEERGVRVHVIAVGTGKALELGRSGDVDVVLVHAREAEDRFVAQGWGVDRRDVMYNDFVILGPADDPAGVKGLTDAIEALRRIHAGGHAFISRGDDSGTHMKELELIAAAGAEPTEAWRMETGQGMGPTLTVADEKRGYTLADRGTYIAYRDKIELAVLVEDPERLANPYGIIAVNPERHGHVNREGAKLLMEWMVSEAGQKAVGEFRIHGETLFFPDAGP